MNNTSVYILQLIDFEIETSRRGFQDVGTDIRFRFKSADSDFEFVKSFHLPNGSSKGEWPYFSPIMNQVSYILDTNPEATIENLAELKGEFFLLIVEDHKSVRDITYKNIIGCIPLVESVRSEINKSFSND